MKLPTIVRDTPLIMHHGFWVKREDLCCPEPGPQFSKIRGCFQHIKSRPEQVIGVVDTRHSKAGWAVAYCCNILGKKCVNYWPVIKAEPNPKESQLWAQKLGASIVGIKATMSAVLYNQAKKTLGEVQGSYMMPNALKLPESIKENAIEALNTYTSDKRTVVISISSGTIAAGVILGLHTKGWTGEVILHLGYSRKFKRVVDYLQKMTKLPVGAESDDETRFKIGRIPIRLIDEGFEYKDSVENAWIEFPCNPYYDAKAFTWAAKNILAKDMASTLFWNVGA